VTLIEANFLASPCALTAGLCLRLFFLLKFPATSGDTVLYEQIATNWLKHHLYAMTVGGKITPVDLRMPGYPAFLAIIYALTGRTGAGRAHLGDAGADRRGSSFLSGDRQASGAFGVHLEDPVPNKRAYSMALWLAAWCPSRRTIRSATDRSLRCFVDGAGMLRSSDCSKESAETGFSLRSTHLALRKSVEYTALGAGLIVGLGRYFALKHRSCLLLPPLFLVDYFCRA